MSHFTKVQTRIADLETLKVALADLKQPFRENAPVRGYMGQSTQAPIVLSLSPSYDVGFTKGVDGNYEAVADWWGVETETKQKRATLLNPIVQRYAYQTVVSQMQKQGFQVVQETTGADQTVKLTVRRWG